MAIEPIGSGLLRDLEGLTTKDLSVSDLAFHALREYAPGDDRRHVHWRSSAKAGRLLVRQFQDTRRSTLCVVVDGAADGYGGPDEFEVAASIGASVAVRACRDGLDVTVVAADQAASGILPRQLLDALSRSEMGNGPQDLGVQVASAAARGSDVSFAVIVSGSGTPADRLTRLAARFGPEVRVVGVRVAPTEPPRLIPGGRAAVVQLAALADLPAMMRAEVAV